MPREIERKFLVFKDLFTPESNSGIKIAQAYLSIRPESTVRVRISGVNAMNGSIRFQYPMQKI